MPKSKIVIGIPTYGKSFILDNAVNNGVGAATTGRGPAGRFTGEAGALSYYEVFKTKYCLIILSNVALFLSKGFVNARCLQNVFMIFPLKDLRNATKWIRNHTKRFSR